MRNRAYIDGYARDHKEMGLLLAESEWPNDGCDGAYVPRTRSGDTAPSRTICSCFRKRRCPASPATDEKRDARDIRNSQRDTHCTCT